LTEFFGKVAAAYDTPPIAANAAIGSRGQTPCGQARGRSATASAKTIDKHYGHLAHDSEDAIRALLDARSGVDVASDGER
jgi:hypothetical protein